MRHLRYVRVGEDIANGITNPICYRAAGNLLELVRLRSVKPATAGILDGLESLFGLGISTIEI